MNEEMLKNINRRLDYALERGREIVEDEELDLKVEELKTQAEATIRKHPIASIAVGVAAGFLLGKILSSDQD